MEHPPHGRSLRPAATGLPADPFDDVRGAVIRAAHEAVITVDEAQRIVMLNPAAQRMFGCSAAEALGSELSRFIPPRHRAAHARHVRAFDASGERERPAALHRTITGLRANGEEFPAEATISRADVADAHGTRHYLIALLRDLSEQQGLQRELAALKQRMRAIFELAPIAIWITDGDHIVFANRACAALFGIADHAHLVGEAIYERIEPGSHGAVRAAVAQAQGADAAIPVISERIARHDGSLRDVEIAVAALPDHGRTAVQMVITDITERNRMTRALEHSRLELRELAASQVQAREEERRRIARELHDELGQRLSALKMELSTLGAPARPAGAASRIAGMIEMVDETVASVRRIATDLRPAMLDDLGLGAAIEWLARESSRRIGVDIRVRLAAGDPPLDDRMAIALYRIVQEALTNIARHARASTVDITMTWDERELVLGVHDNGVGFALPQRHVQGSHGLLGIRERAYMLGGHVEVDNAPEGGGRVTVRLPLAGAASTRGEEPA